jgi:hypothetical protein
MHVLRDRALAGLASLLAAGLAIGQEPAPPPLDPALPDQLKELKTLVADPKMRSDFQAIALLQKLTQEPGQRHPKDKERLAKALGDVFRTGKVRPGANDILYRETADALARFAVDGGKELAKAATDKRFDDNRGLQAHLLLALGRTQDPAQVELLTDIATRSPHDELRAAAGEALGSYTELDAKARRPIVKALLREWGALHQLATTPDPTDPNAPIDFAPQNARRTLRAIEGKWNRTLQRLTGTSHSQFPEWQRWLNKNPNWTPPGER